MPYNLRISPTLFLPKTRSFYYGKNAIHFRGSLIWNNLQQFIIWIENKIKNIWDFDCACLICRDIFDLYVIL